MRFVLALLIGACLVAALACGSSQPKAAEPSAPADAGTPEDEAAAAAPDPDAAPPMTTIQAPPPPSSPSTMSFEEATAKPEPIEVNDERFHLTDAQLTNPLRGAFDRCRVPPNAKVTIRTAVQNGRAIGVTVDVELKKPKPPPKPKRLTKAQAKAALAAAKAEAQLIAKIKTCTDHAVRGLSWPPSHRRDTFTTTL